MNDKNIRFSELRKHLKLSQEKFGAKMGLSKSGISSIESGARNVSENHIKLLAASFNINENWLRYGTGEMFLENDTINFDDFIKQKEATPLEIEIIKAYFNIEPSKRKEALQTFKNLINHFDIYENQNLGDSKNEISATIEKKIAEKVELYRNELIDSEKGETLSAIPMQKENIS